MSYFDILPAELLQEILYYVDDPGNLLNISNFQRVLGNRFFWVNKIKMWMPMVDLSLYPEFNTELFFFYNNHSEKCESFIRYYNSLWKSYKLSIGIIDNALKYADRGGRVILDNFDSKKIVEYLGISTYLTLGSLQILYILPAKEFRYRFTLNQIFQGSLKFEQVVNIMTYFNYIKNMYQKIKS